MLSYCFHWCETQEANIRLSENMLADFALYCYNPAIAPLFVSIMNVYVFFS